VRSPPTSPTSPRRSTTSGPTLVRASPSSPRSAIDGRHPRDRGEVQGAAVALVARLGRLHASVGIEQRRLSEVASEQIASGWAFAAEHLDVAGPLDAKVRALLRRDALLDVSLGHGDLVGSNLLLDERGRVVLIDWEHAGPLPIAFDLAKLHVQARNSAAAFAAFRRGLGNRVGRTRGGYRLHEQFALGHVQMLSWHEHRLARATEAGREKQLRQDTRRRLDRLEELLGSEPTLVLL
jgi:thiamine kinase-like enzyme